MGVRKTTVALVGNPNVGKSTLFNTLTGMRQHTGNWPGKTVGVARGYRKDGEKLFEFVDLPGTYTLNGGSEDERIAAEFITSGQADWTVAVCDGTALERNLILALQVRLLTPNFILVISLMDEAERRGIEIDAQKLSDLLEVPELLTASGRKQDIKRLLDLLSCEPTDNIQPEYHVPCVVCAAEMIADQCINRSVNKQLWREKADKLLLSSTWGVVILLALLMIMVWLTVSGANVPSRMLEILFQNGYDFLENLLRWSPGWFRGILLDAAYATSAQVISVMLPPMAIFFTLFSLLEDIGYLPRMAFLLDGSMRRCGGCGKQALTMCMGLGCNAVGVTSCRIIESPRERLLAVLTNAMIPCNGRFPTLIFLATLTFGKNAPFAVGTLVLVAVMTAMLTSGILSKTALNHEQSYFLMEIPPLRCPRIGKVLSCSLLDRTIHIALRALKVAAPAGIILWCFANVGLLQTGARVLNPMGAFLGMNGAILLGFVLSLPANELLIPICMMAITGSSTLWSAGELRAELVLGTLSIETMLCMMIFTLFHWPCATTIATIYQETKSYKKTAAAVILPTAVGSAICMLLHFLIQHLGC